ncbi:MAG: N-6 DNA methylase [Rhodospirillales bacterium]|nr:N-6 DNA methylase [Rhodospirillales bacterium]
MNGDSLSQRWAGHFGLALTPLFETDSADENGSHNVLLDGGFGSFALSVTKQQLWREEKVADWAWSSNLPHHVTVTDKIVAVTRWDRPHAEVFNRTSVEKQLEAFYTYLTTDRVRSSQRVVDYVLGLFRRVRSLVAEAKIPDDRSIDAFLAFLGRLIELDKSQRGSEQNQTTFDVELAELLLALPANAVESLINEVANGISPQAFKLFPALAVRHAGSEIFQEAHFELLRAPGIDLFGYTGPAEAKAVTRGGAHFTPPALARTVVEQALLQVERVQERDQLVVLDPACGSGAFLHEAIRTLRRLNFSGEITLIGRDSSRAAVSMANFAVRHAAADWSPRPRPIRIDIQIADSLDADLPVADLILMNPPFVAWAALDERQRDQMRQILGTQLAGRGDLSMAFVTRAVDRLSPGGALGVLVPASLLTLQAAEAWRADLLNRTDLCLLAALGDYNLFAYALVQVAVMVLAKPLDRNVRRRGITALVTTNSADATGNALRTLRRCNPGERYIYDNKAWALFEIPAESFRSRPVWRLTSPRTEAALSRLMRAGALSIGELFDVRQGVRTGRNEAFILEEPQISALPAHEKKYFRPAVMNESIQGGKIQRRFWIFYPYDREGLVLKTEDELQKAVPSYYKKYLLPNKEILKNRANIIRSNRHDWWGISEHRPRWALDPTPRIVSKYFGSAGGFSVDLDASFIVVQGFAWIPKWERVLQPDTEDVAPLSTDDFLCGFVALLNSQRFGQVLNLFCPHVAGGQLDLSPRYLNNVPLPNLIDIARDERGGRMVAELIELGRKPRLEDADWHVSANRITTALYGEDFFDQV